MNACRLVPSLVVLGIWLAASVPAGAHRLDEYLQATRVAIDLERVQLEIDLTPGVALASEIFAAIDANGDRAISRAEGDAYAQQILGSVVLSMDGRSVPIALVDIRVPAFREMGLGVGIIRLRAAANIRGAASGRHHVTYSNTHRSESSVYLVNALAPTDSRIQITSQQRDRAQHALTIDYTVVADAAWARTWSLFAGLAMAGMLVWTRRGMTSVISARSGLRL